MAKIVSVKEEGVAEATGDARFDKMMGNIVKDVPRNDATDFGTPYLQTSPGVVAKALRGALLGITDEDTRIYLGDIITQLRSGDPEQISDAKQSWHELFGENGLDIEIFKLAKKKFPYIDVVGFFDQGVAEDNTAMDPSVIQMKKRAKIAHPFASSDEEALALYVADKSKQAVRAIRTQQASDEKIIDRIDKAETKLEQEVGRIDAVLAKLSGKVR